MYHLIRKILIFWVVMLTITGCGAKDKEKAIKILSEPIYKQNVEVKINEINFSGELTHEEGGNIILTLTSHDLLTPITFAVTEDKITVSQNKLSMARAAYHCPSVMLYNSFKALPNGKISANGAYYTLSYDCFMCKIDVKKEKIVKITFPNTEVIFN